MTARSEVVGDKPICGEKPLGLAWRLAPLHVPFPLSCWLEGVLGVVVERAVLSVLHTREHRPLRCAVAFAFVRDDHPWSVLTALQERAEELLGSLLVLAPLHQDVEHHAILIHRPPQSVLLVGHRDAYGIHVPLLTRPGTPAPALMGIRLATFATPHAHGFVRAEDTTDAQQCFHVPVAERKAAIPPDGVAGDLPRQPMLFREMRRG